MASYLEIESKGEFDRLFDKIYHEGYEEGHRRGVVLALARILYAIEIRFDEDIIRDANDQAAAFARNNDLLKLKQKEANL